LEFAEFEYAAFEGIGDKVFLIIAHNISVSE
jgi:hypothetical protein